MGNSHEIPYRLPECYRAVAWQPLTLLTTDSAVDLVAASEPLICQTLTDTQQSQLRITGYLGAFRVEVAPANSDTLNLAQALIERDVFDVVLDLTAAGISNATHSWEIPPPGYVCLDSLAPEKRGAARL